VSEGLVETISSSTVRRWLHAAAIKPWQYRSWIFTRDRDFAGNINGIELTVDGGQTQTCAGHN
jgi:hypothetical protein